jgi:ADP-heptose:LPS heptosyltransferase
MGALVVIRPSLEKVKKMYPNSEIYFMTFKENISLLKILNIVPEKNIYPIRTDSFFSLFYDTIKNIFRARKEGIDTVVDLEFFSRFSAIFSFLTGARRKVGFHRFFSEGLYRGEFMTHKVGYNPYLHAGLSFLSLVYALKYPPGEIVIQEKLSMDELKIHKIKLSKQKKDNIWQKLKQENNSINSKSTLVVLSPGTGEWLPERKWPLKYNLGLIKKILASPKNYVIVTGTNSAKKDIEFFKKEIKDDRLIDLVNKTSFEEFIDLLNISKLLVSVDSGPTHFACLTDIWIISIFGPETKKIFGPLSEKAIGLESGLACHPCFSVFNSRKCSCVDKEKKCLKSISVDRVFKHVKEILG